MDKMGRAADREDPTTLGITCQEAAGAVEHFRQHLPSPDPKLTAQLEKALSDYDAAASICTTAMENHNPDDLEQAATLIREGNTYMDNAVDILRRDRGESSDTSGRQGCSSPSDSSALDIALRLRPLPRKPRIPSRIACNGCSSSRAQTALRPGKPCRLVDPPNQLQEFHGTLDYRPRRRADVLPGPDLAGTQQLRQNYPAVRLLWAGDWRSTFSSPDFWVTVVGITFPESGGALTWCRSQGLDQDRCSPPTYVPERVSTNRRSANRSA